MSATGTSPRGGGVLRCLMFCAACMALLLGSRAMAAQIPESMGQEGKRCDACHAIPPGTGPEDGRFKPGAHAQHVKFGCDRCHPDAADTISEAHVDGVVRLKPEIEYQYGSELPWPSMGSGSCGGLGYPYPPTGCHQRMPNATCAWVPGKQCQPPAKP